MSSGGNDIAWAMRALRNGMPVTRLAWSTKGSSRELALNGDTIWCSYSTDCFPIAWHATHTDLFATDWVLASDVKVKL